MREKKVVAVVRPYIGLQKDMLCLVLFWILSPIVIGMIY